MPTTFETALEKYLRGRNLASGTRDEYVATLRKWKRWGNGASIEELTRRNIREFLDWVHEDALKQAREEVAAEKAEQEKESVAPSLANEQSKGSEDEVIEESVGDILGR